MLSDFKSILENHPCAKSVELFADGVENIRSKSTQVFRLYAHENGHDWKLLICIHDSFPLALPEIILENAEDYSAMGHIDWLGNICYLDKQGLVVDYKKPEDVLTDCVTEAIRTLDENYNDKYKTELQNDFRSYWESYLQLHSNFFKTACAVTPDENVKELTSYRDSKNERQIKFASCLAIVEDENDINEHYHLLHQLKNKKKSKSIYIPLEKFVELPSPKQIWKASDIFDVFEKSVSRTTRELTKEIISKHKWSNFFTVIFSHPNITTGRTLWGVEFHRKDTACHPLISPQDSWDICPMKLRIINKDYLLERCGSSINLNTKKVAIIGCGSIGGNVAFQLAKAGIGELHLIDFDKMEIENIYRHMLGGTAIDIINNGFYKSDFLAYQIETNIPYVKIRAFKENLLDILPAYEQENYDAIIITTGDFTSELLFNSVHKKTLKLVPVIYGWQDGFGVGGHAISVKNDGSVGCLECLYTTSFGFTPHPKTSFIKCGQIISKHLGGCSGVFTPFSFLDASQTALLVSRMALEALQGKAKNEIRSWKGSNEQLKAEGYATSIWYEKSPENFIQDETKYIADNCQVCSNKNTKV